jgi:c-di-GMP-binding flagellar brake protein YcgR
MRSEGRFEKLLSNQFGLNGDNQNPDADADKPKSIRIPFKIDDGIIVRSLTNSSYIAKSRIVGAMHGDCILVTEPTVQINERISAVLDEAFLCAYFNDGILYSFHSRYRKHLINDIVCIEYPKEAEARQVRKHRRIKVNIETEYSISGTLGAFVADMVDISRGGCRLMTGQRVPISKGTSLSLAFNLPNEAFVNGLQAQAVRIDHTKGGKGAEIGLSFTGPPDELLKIANFCEFCMYFDLE